MAPGRLALEAVGRPQRASCERQRSGRGSTVVVVKFASVMVVQRFPWLSSPLVMPCHVLFMAQVAAERRASADALPCRTGERLAASARLAVP